MTEFLFLEELPPKASRSACSDLIYEFAAALRARPGVWGRWPQEISATAGGNITTKIRNGTLKPFEEGRFEAVSRNGAFYVRCATGVPHGA